MRYKCIIFDCDGVLVDSEAISNQVVVDLANSYGARIDLNYAVEHFAGTSLKHVQEHIEQITRRKLPEDFANDYRRISYEKFQTDLKPVPGIHELVSKVPVPFCVATNGPLYKTRLNLKLVNLLDAFEGKIFSAYEVGHWKPDPILFLHAAKQMGFLPEDCVVIEDSISGVTAAKAGGFEVFAYTNKHKEAAFIKEGVTVFNRMDALPGLLGIS